MTRKIGFHSPLTTNQVDEEVIYPTSHIVDVLTASDSSGADMIEQALTTLGIVYTHDAAGKLTAMFANEELGWKIRFRFLLEGETCRIFSLEGMLEKLLPTPKLGEALLMCNVYATHYSFGRFSVRREAPAQGKLILAFDATIDVTNRISVAFLQTYIASHIGTACAFLSRGDVYHALFSTRQKAKKKGSGKPNDNGTESTPETISQERGEPRFRIV